MRAQRRAALRKDSPRAVGGGPGAHDIGKRREWGTGASRRRLSPSDTAAWKRATSARPASPHTTAATDAATSAATPSAAAKPAAKNPHVARAAGRERGQQIAERDQQYPWVAGPAPMPRSRVVHDGGVEDRKGLLVAAPPGADIAEADLRASRVSSS
ncbi:hypothetical protein [Paraburkholderia sp. EG304]|uniref:hypothetical protein n=1 Tax=Paraburkholderia sp. EG304 TaxID=3237015 RepID=UPI003979BF42